MNQYENFLFDIIETTTKKTTALRAEDVNALPVTYSVLRRNGVYIEAWMPLMPACAGYCYVARHIEATGATCAVLHRDMDDYAETKPAIGVAIQPASSLGWWTTSGYRFRLTKTLEAVIHSDRTGN